MKAFPSREKVELANTFAIYGMDLRDYFAAKAMKRVTFAGHPRIKEPDEGWMLRDAKTCYEIADAMMKAREL